MVDVPEVAEPLPADVVSTWVVVTAPRELVSCTVQLAPAGRSVKVRVWPSFSPKVVVESTVTELTPLKKVQLTEYRKFEYTIGVPLELTALFVPTVLPTTRLALS